MRRDRSGEDDSPLFPIAPVLFHYNFDVDPDEDCWWRPVVCEFHGETTASASYNTELGLFKCHGCDIRGRAEHVIMKKEGVSFAEACQIAQALTGVSGRKVQPEHRPGSRLSGGKRDRPGVRKAVRPGSRLRGGRSDSGDAGT